MNIFQISYERLKMLPEQFLNDLTSTQYLFGKNCERYWMLNTTTNLTNQPTFEIDFINKFLFLVRAKGFDSLMIIK